MSRGGRGGGGGRGAFSAGFAGIESRFGLETEPGSEKNEERDSKPSETFPAFALPVVDEPTWAEQRAVHHYRTLRARIHDGPLYCVLDSSTRLYKSHHGRDERQRTPPTAHFDAFGEQETYAQRFKKKRNVLPNLKTRPFVKEFFPRELWRTMGVEGNADEEGREKKRLKISNTRFDKWMKDTKHDEDEDIEKADDDDEPPEEEKPEVDHNLDKDDDDSDKEEVDPDQFEDDEDDDYNAEQYFESGADDDIGDDGGGGGGGGDDDI